MHKDRVKFARTRLPAGTQLPDGWKVVSENPFAVAGLCPKCLGDAYGPVLKNDSESRELAEEDPVATIIAECQCGSEHGEDGATGCGRWWPIAIDRAGSNTFGERQ